MIKFTRTAFYILCIVLLINSCHCKRLTYKGNEIILFLGERAAGKSTLCNSIFGKAVFKSGLSIYTNMTTVKQEHIHEGKLYIDTPGFAEGNINDQVAKEIEAALKYNSNYKIVFVVKSVGVDLDRSKIDMINKICNTIKTDFEYGIIFNQISRKRIQKMEQAEIDPKKLHESVYMPMKPTKLPSLSVVLEEDEALKDEDNKYFQANDKNRKKLLNFLNELNAHKIASNEVSKIVI